MGFDIKNITFLFEVGINDRSHDYLQNHSTLNSCNYVFDPSSDFDLSFKAGFSILHLIVRSFNKNQDLINSFISNLNFTFSIIALSETWFKDNIIDISNYNPISVPRQNRRSGGTALYVHNSLSFKVRPDLNLIQTDRNDIDHSESVFVEIICRQSKNIIVGNVYRAHRTDIDSFNSDLSNCLDRISLENKLCYISGDFNFDILQYDTDNKVNAFVNNFYSHDMFPLIDRPTRIVKNSATILDNIFTNVLSKQIKSGIFVNDITDHYPVFQVTDCIDLNTNHSHTFFNCRSFNQDNIKCFKNSLQLTGWDHIMNDSSPTNAYSNFMSKFNDMYNRSFPVKRKRISQAKGIPQKPWITKAILKSIKRKDKLYRKYRSSQTASKKRALSEYKNKLTTIIRASKKQYYCNLLDEHKRDLKKDLGSPE